MSEMTVSPSLFKRLNKLMLLNWRLGLGPWINRGPIALGRYMVVITTGRRSGLKRRTPVNYARIDGDAYCMAGFGRRSDWYRNLEATPEVEVWLPDGWWAGRAETVTDPEEWLPIMRQVMINSGFATPVFMGLDPRTVSDDKLREVGAEIPVVRIRLERRVSGPGGPADLAWVWLVSGLAMLAWWWMRQRRRHQ